MTRRQPSAIMVAGLALFLLTSAAAFGRQQDKPQSTANDRQRVTLTTGHSTVFSTSFDIRRFAVTDPAIADATAVRLRELLIDGKAAGVVTLMLWGDTDRLEVEIAVEPAVLPLQQQLRTLFPQEDIRVTASNEVLILSGDVSSNAVAMEAAEIAQASSSKSRVINLLRRPGDASVQQVMLQVRFAEVDRRALTELGVNLIARREKFDARTTTQQFAAPTIDDTRQQAPIVFSDFLNLFYFWNPEGLGAVIRALQSKGYFHSLAEPNLIAYNGQEASFLAGGSFPIPVVTGAVGTVSVTYQEFGVKLKFTPTIIGDVIRLKVAPEVSTLDFNNGITMSGFRIPALIARRAETTVELQDGQSFAIAGLLNNTSDQTGDRIPGLGSLPIIGPLFRSKSTQTERTELLVLITPHLARPLDPSQVPPLPVDPSLFLQPEKKKDGGAPAQQKPVKNPGGGQ